MFGKCVKKFKIKTKWDIDIAQWRALSNIWSPVIDKPKIKDDPACISKDPLIKDPLEFQKYINIYSTLR